MKNNTTKRIKPKYTIYANNLSNNTDVYASLAFAKIKKHLIDTSKMSDLEFNAMCETIGNEAINVWLNSEDSIKYIMNIPGVKDMINDMTNMFSATCDMVSYLSTLAEDNKNKKLPWYKRFWNWITRK